MYGHFQDYSYQMLGSFFHYTVLGGARVLVVEVGVIRGNKFEAPGRDGEELLCESCRGGAPLV